MLNALRINPIYRVLSAHLERRENTHFIMVRYREAYLECQCVVWNVFGLLPAAIRPIWRRLLHLKCNTAALNLLGLITIKKAGRIGNRQ